MQRISVEVTRHMSVEGARPRKYSSQRYDWPNAQLTLKVQVLEGNVLQLTTQPSNQSSIEAEVVKVILRSESLRNVPHKLLLQAVGFSRKGHSGHKTLSYTAVLEITQCEHVETPICRGSPRLRSWIDSRFPRIQSSTAYDCCHVFLRDLDSARRGSTSQHVMWSLNKM